MFTQVEHTYTVYYHSFGLLQIMELRPFIGLGAFWQVSPLAQTWHFDIICHLHKIQLCSKYFDWERGGHGLIKSFFLY